MSHKHPDDPGSMAPREPQMEFITLAGLAAALGLGGTTATGIYKHLRSPEPLLFQVLDSTSNNDEHVITIRVSNVTASAVYIESLEWRKPRLNGFVTTAVRIRSAGIDFGTTAPPNELDLPVRLLPGDQLTFGVTCAVREVAGDKGGELRINFTELDEQKEAHRDVKCRFR